MNDKKNEMKEQKLQKWNRGNEKKTETQNGNKKGVKTNT